MKIGGLELDLPNFVPIGIRVPGYKDMARKKMEVDLELLLNSTTTDGSNSRGLNSIPLSSGFGYCPCSWYAEILPSAWWRQGMRQADPRENSYSAPG